MTLINKCFYMFTHFVYENIILYINYTLTISKVKYNTVIRGVRGQRGVKGQFFIFVLTDSIII